MSERKTAELSSAECRCTDKRTPQLLDVVEIPILRAQPKRHQTENFVIDATRRWIRKGRIEWNQLEMLRDCPTSLWVNSESTVGGAYDRISRAEAVTVNFSLLMIKPDDFKIEVRSNPWRGTIDCRSAFRYNGQFYNLSVTDPAIRDRFQTRPEGCYPLANVYLTVSLTEPYVRDEKCYKVVAGVMEEQ